MYGLLYSDGVKGKPSPTCLRKYREKDEEEAVAKRAIKELEIFVSQIFYNLFHLLLFFFYHFFSILVLPHDIYPTPTPTTHTHMTHDLYPLPTTHDI